MLAALNLSCAKNYIKCLGCLTVIKRQLLSKFYATPLMFCFKLFYYDGLSIEELYVFAVGLVLVLVCILFFKSYLLD